MNKSKLFNMSLTTQMLVASVLGLIAGLIFGQGMGNLKFIGDIFLRLMQMSVVILVLGAIIEAVGALNPKDLGKLGGKAITLFVVTTAIASALGLLLALIIQPGTGMVGVNPGEYTGTLASGKVTDMIATFFPKNIFEAMAGGNILQVIIFAVFAGLALSFLGKNESGVKVFEMVRHLNVVIMQIVKIVMRFAPFGIFALLGAIVGVSGWQILIPLGKFLIALTVGCLAFLALLVVLVAAYGKISPFRLLRKLERTIIVSITTTSSAVSLPVQMADSEERLGISKRVSRLVNPLGMSLNSDGLGITVAIACVTVAQFFGIVLTGQQMIMIVLISTLATFANLAVPGGALVTMAIAFQMAGLPLEGIAILAGVDWFAGIIRTLLNVVDDVLMALVVAISEKEFDRSVFNSDDVLVSDEGLAPARA
jgi:Na+/H+-dicarboxylate symporter